MTSEQILSIQTCTEDTADSFGECGGISRDVTAIGGAIYDLTRAVWEIALQLAIANERLARTVNSESPDSSKEGKVGESEA